MAATPLGAVLDLHRSKGSRAERAFRPRPAALSLATSSLVARLARRRRPKGTFVFNEETEPESTLPNRNGTVTHTNGDVDAETAADVIQHPNVCGVGDYVFENITAHTFRIIS
jgi:hypothetical protein